MKKLIIRISTVAIASAVIYIVVILLMLSIGKINRLPNVRYSLGGYGYTLLRLQEAKQINEVDILFIGSSHVYRAFDTRIFEQNGLRTFNLGTSAQPPFVSYFLLRDLLTQAKTKHVVMDLYWGVLQNESVEAGVDIVSNSPINETVIDIVEEGDDFLLYNTLLVSSIRQFFKPLSKEDQRTYKNDQYIKFGFVESKLSKNKLDEKKLSSLKSITFKPAIIQVQFLNKIIRLCQEKNIKLTLVVTPVTKEYLNTVMNYEDYSTFINKLATTNGVPLYDYNFRNELILDSQYDFNDKNHLNQSGVVKFNNLFLEDFKSQYNSIAAWR